VEHIPTAAVWSIPGPVDKPSAGSELTSRVTTILLRSPAFCHPPSPSLSYHRCSPLLLLVGLSSGRFASASTTSAEKGVAVNSNSHNALEICCSSSFPRRPLAATVCSYFLQPAFHVPLVSRHFFQTISPGAALVLPEFVANSSALCTVSSFCLRMI
jgi:hypothetical protein